MVPGVKRFGNGLIPFPRVGRSGTGPKRNGADGGGALWFGPRLGKRTYDNMPDPSALGMKQPLFACKNLFCWSLHLFANTFFEYYVFENFFFIDSFFQPPDLQTK